mmetsp:Transcript_49237/g.96581  ORF Transcript_49237/g.96581 Transcript_49237/m.96581 type:complete len:254 (-) Transcript_49237:284-1045(-)
MISHPMTMHFQENLLGMCHMGIHISHDMTICWVLKSLDVELVNVEVVNLLFLFQPLCQLRVRNDIGVGRERHQVFLSGAVQAFFNIQQAAGVTRHRRIAVCSFGTHETVQRNDFGARKLFHDGVLESKVPATTSTHDKLWVVLCEPFGITPRFNTAVFRSNTWRVRARQEGSKLQPKIGLRAILSPLISSLQLLGAEFDCSLRLNIEIIVAVQNGQAPVKQVGQRRGFDSWQQLLQLLPKPVDPFSKQRTNVK